MIASYYTSRMYSCKAATQTGTASRLQATTSEEHDQGPYVAASGFEPATFRTEGSEHHRSATTPLNVQDCTSLLMYTLIVGYRIKN